MARYRLKVGVALHQPGVVHHIADKGQGEQRFNSAGCAGDNADGAGGRNRNRGRIPHSLRAVASVVCAAFPFRKHAPPFCQLPRCPVSFLLDKLHHLLGQFRSLNAVVADAQLDQQIRPPHHAQADAPGFAAHLGNFRNRVIVHINDAVQHMDGGGNHFRHSRPVNLNIVRRVAHHPRQIERAEVAGFVRQQGLFPAGIGGLNIAQLRVGIVPVDAVQKDDAGVAGAPGQFRHPLKDGAGVEPAGRCASARVHQVIFLPASRLLHKVLGNRYRYVEIAEALPILFGGNERQDVRVRYVQDAHIGAAPGAALLDDIGSRVKGVDKADRPGCHAPGRADHIPLRPQP